MRMLFCLSGCCVPSCKAGKTQRGALWAMGLAAAYCRCKDDGRREIRRFASLYPASFCHPPAKLTPEIPSIHLDFVQTHRRGQFLTHSEWKITQGGAGYIPMVMPPHAEEPHLLMLRGLRERLTFFYRDFCPSKVRIHSEHHRGIDSRQK
jgi:hypothetical protein